MARLRSARAIAPLLVAVAVGVVGAWVALHTGPTHIVDCTAARWPDSMFGDRLGHVDGPSSTGCVVPNTVGWLIALSIPVVLVTVTLLATRGPMTPDVDPSA